MKWGFICATIMMMALPGCEPEQWLHERLYASGNLTLEAIIGLLIGGSFFSEDLVCVSAGVWASQALIPFWLAALACSFGVWFSDSVLYLWGVLGRKGLLDRAPLKWIVKREKVERGSVLFGAHGAKMIVLSRFLPGSRLPIYVAAGLLRYPYRKFAFWMALAALGWAPPMVWLSMKLGDALLGWLRVYEKAAWILLPLIILLIWAVMRGLEWFVGQRSTRLLEAKEPKSGQNI